MRLTAFVVALFLAQTTMAVECPDMKGIVARLKTFSKDRKCVAAFAADELRTALKGGETRNKCPPELDAIKGFPFSWEDQDKSVVNKCLVELKALAQPTNALPEECKKLLGQAFWPSVEEGVTRLAKTKLKEFRAFRSKHGYKNTKWGMTPKEVRRLFPKAKHSGNFVGLATTINGKSANLVFEFTHDKLTRTIIGLNERYINANHYVVDFGTFKQLLTKKYGEPKEDRHFWSQDMYKDMGTQYLGTAVAMGQLKLQTSWETDETFIDLDVQGENAKVQVAIVYRSKTLDAFREQAAQQVATDDL